MGKKWEKNGTIFSKLWAKMELCSIAQGVVEWTFQALERAVFMERDTMEGALSALFFDERWWSVSNEKNLIPMDQRSEDEARELGRKGGIASGAARRRKRSLKEAADLFLSMSVTDKRRYNKIAAMGVDPEDIDNQMAMIIGLTMAATAGDARAAQVVIDLLGEESKDTGGEVQIVDDIPEC